MRSQELLIFRQFRKPLKNFVTKTLQSCSQRVPVMGGLQVGLEVWTFLTYDFAAYKIDSLTSQ